MKEELVVKISRQETACRYQSLVDFTGNKILCETQETVTKAIQDVMDKEWNSL